MRKNMIRIGAGVAVAAGLAVGGAAIATAEDDPYPSVAEQQAIWNQGGAEVGGGLAKLVSAAWVGIPAQALDFFQEGSASMSGLAPVK